MNKLIHILSFILMLLVIGAPSCMDEEEVARQELQALEEVRADIRNEFEMEYLSEAAHYAYETNAKQKLTDLADYMQVLIDTSLENSFRQKAGQMIQDLFQSENEKVQLNLNESNPSKELKIHYLIKKGLNNKLTIQPFSFENIQSLKPLQRENQYTYFGVISFSQQYFDPSNPDQSIQSIQRTSEFYVVKEIKKFGNDSLKIWNVRLGQIQ